jgi:CheY-like chemotaxis protein
LKAAEPASISGPSQADTGPPAHTSEARGLAVNGQGCEPHAAATQDGPRRILYVEDNPINVLLMQAVFDGQHECLLDVVDTGEKALEALSRHRPDALMIDMHLPDTNGASLLGQMRRRADLSGVPAIAVSADAMPTDIERALQAGFVDYWTKPIDVARVLPGLRDLIESARATDGTMSD